MHLDLTVHVYQTVIMGDVAALRTLLKLIPEVRNIRPPKLELFAAIPGLALYDQVFHGSSQRQLLKRSRELLRSIEQCSIVSATDFMEFPQPHDCMSGERTFSRLSVSDLSAENRVLSCKYFESFGSPHHSQSQFSAEFNIPAFARRQVLPYIRSLPHLHVLQSKNNQHPVSIPQYDSEFDSFSENDQPAACAMQMNHYKVFCPATVLYDYHVDQPSFGDATAIVTLGSTGYVQFAASDDYAVHAGANVPTTSNPATIILPPGSVLVASGDARWNFRRRVIDAPRTFTHRYGDERHDRFSLVFGCKL